ncbi:hypothetical protein VNO77_44359 [Canavalia gladiata]|uniref:Uncharacterized protein n=1 Tax=Canavalia gladiata TaxID=3824 RepID=A0AAN9JVT8_CANGL
MHVAVLLSYTHIGTYGHCVFLTLTWHSWDNCVGKFQEYGAWLMQGLLLARLCMTFFVGPLLRPSVPLGNDECRRQDLVCYKLHSSFHGANKTSSPFSYSFNFVSFFSFPRTFSCSWSLFFFLLKASLFLCLLPFFRRILTEEKKTQPP